MEQENSCDGTLRQPLGSLVLSSAMSAAFVRTRLPHLFLPPPPFSPRNRDKDLVSFLGSVEWFFRLNEGYLQLHPHLTRKWPSCGTGAPKSMPLQEMVPYMVTSID